jgi:hypothetical protein
MYRGSARTSSTIWPSRCVKTHPEMPRSLAIRDGESIVVQPPATARDTSSSVC